MAYDDENYDDDNDDNDDGCQPVSYDGLASVTTQKMKGGDADEMERWAKLTEEEKWKERAEELETRVLPNLSKPRLERAMVHLSSRRPGLDAGVTVGDDNGDDNYVVSKMDGPTSKKKKRLNKRSLAAARARARMTEHAVAAADAERVLQSSGVGSGSGGGAGGLTLEKDTERTHRVTQAELKRQLHSDAARQIFDLDLETFGSYGTRYDRSGRWALLFGRKGHVSTLDATALAQGCEFWLNNGSGTNAETIVDGTFLHNPTLFALAQKRHVYIYDDKGSEIHRVTELGDPLALEYLSYHWLLASVGRTGHLRYMDVSCGQLVTTHATRKGPCSIVKQNPRNAVLHLGHGDGTVSLYAPSHPDPLVRMFTGTAAPVRDLAIDPTGTVMAVASADSRLRIWDLRTYRRCLATVGEPLDRSDTTTTAHHYTCRFAPPTSLDISQTGILGVGHGTHATFWGSRFAQEVLDRPYMHCPLGHGKHVQTLRFRPFEDACALGHLKGLSSVIIPGSGSPDLDSHEFNTDPYQDNQQRREAEVRSLLEKLDPNTIALRSSDLIGALNTDKPIVHDPTDGNGPAHPKLKPPRIKNKARGRSKIGNQLARKKRNVIDAQVQKKREQERERRKEEQEKKKKKNANKKGGNTDALNEDVPLALQRFYS